MLAEIILQPFHQRLEMKLATVASVFAQRFTAADLREMDRLGRGAELRQSPEAARFRNALNDIYGVTVGEFTREIPQWIPSLWMQLNRRLVAEGMRPVRNDRGWY